MDKPVQVTFHNLQHSDAVEQDVLARVAKLDAAADLTGCRVVIDCPHRTPNGAKSFAVRVEMSLRGQSLVVTREPLSDLQMAINDAFDTAKRRLRNHREKQRA